VKGIITLCGSTRFKGEFQECSLELTLADYVVLSVGCFTHSDNEIKDRITPVVKIQLDKLHKEKIAMSQAIVVINKDNYIGESTLSELQYARQLNKQVYWYEYIEYDPNKASKYINTFVDKDWMMLIL